MTLRHTLLLSLAVLISPALSAAGVDVAARAITVPIYQEPRTLDSMSGPTVEFTAEIMAHLQEGLMRLDERGRVVGGVAETWEMTPEAVRFHLRRDARWEDGRPVTAHDFVYAWRALVTPATGSQSANLASPIRNAVAILRGDMPPEALGVAAVSDHELLVELAHPCGWCVKLMTSAAFYPVNQAFHEATGSDAYATSPATHLANGPFRLTNWQRGKTITLTRNPEYWRRDEVYLDRLHYGYIANDFQALLNLYRSGDIAIATIGRGTLDEAMRLGQRIQKTPGGYLFHLQFSHVDGMLSANEDIRRAVSLVIDKDEVVNRVLATPGSKVADALFHDWMTVNDQRLRQVLQTTHQAPDLELARRHLAQAKADLGITGRPQLVFTIFDSDDQNRFAEYLQSRLALIGIDLKIDPQIVKVLLDKWFKGQSDINMIGWVLDVNDPIDQISFMGNPATRGVFKGLYRGQDMIDVYHAYRDASAPLARRDALQAAHDLFTNRVTVYPLYERYTSRLIDPRMKGYVFQPVRAFNDYRYVRLVDNE